MANTRPCHCCRGSGTEMDHLLVGAELRKIREKKGIALTELADRMKFTGAYISDLERGKRNWNLDLIARFKKAVGA